MATLRTYFRFMFMLLAMGTSNSSALAQTEANQDKAEAQPTQKETAPDSPFTLFWAVSLVVTAILSPIIVELVKRRLSGDPVREKSERLRLVIDTQAARQTQGLAPDLRLTALINELTDDLGDEAKGKQQALDESTSFLIGTLTCRLVESLYHACHHVALLLDSKHNGPELVAIYDLTQLEFLRTYWGYRRLAVPNYMQRIGLEELDAFASKTNDRLEELGPNAIANAEAIGTTGEAVAGFVDQLRAEIINIRDRQLAEQGNAEQP